MSEASEKYWFSAKSYGWGWGLPSAWQGWLVLALFMTSLVALPFVISPSDQLALFLVVVTVLSGFLLGVCYLKGEPPKWRWGGKNC